MGCSWIAGIDGIAFSACGAMMGLIYLFFFMAIGELAFIGFADILARFQPLIGERWTLANGVVVFIALRESEIVFPFVRQSIAWLFVQRSEQAPLPPLASPGPSRKLQVLPIPEHDREG